LSSKYGNPNYVQIKRFNKFKVGDRVIFKELGNAAGTVIAERSLGSVVEVKLDSGETKILFESRLEYEPSKLRNVLD
jgi:hypothetical protein